MQQETLAQILVDYVSWRSRYVGARPRTVTIEGTATADPRWSTMSAAITSFLERVKRGDDLTPHLSFAPHTRGYTPASRARRASPEERWSDKDFILNTMSYHHFHLGTTVEAAGHVARTDEVMLAEVTRDRFNVVAIFDHTVFEQPSAERQRLWSVHQQILARQVPAGAFVIMGGIASSGHDVRTVLHAQDCVRCIKRIDPQPDSHEYVRGLYNFKDDAPAKPKPEWAFEVAPV